MDRTPPVEVLRQLRREVGFGCPVPACGSPYLHWHHFDPPWRERPHHDPDGMIALCGEHHDKADVGAFTKEQLRQFKASGRAQAAEVRGKFDWMRREIVGAVGGSFYHETPILIQFRDEPMIWLNRDEDGYLLLNLRMLSVSGQPRLRVTDNYWITRGEPTDFECPPSGRRIRARYANRDDLSIEFFDVRTLDDARSRYPNARPESWPWSFPFTAVEVQFAVGGTEIHFGPRLAVLPGHNIVQGTFSRCGRGLVFG